MNIVFKNFMQQINTFIFREKESTISTLIKKATTRCLKIVLSVNIVVFL